jgi:tRNA (guanine-N7-)-methyltransferase
MNLDLVPSELDITQPLNLEDLFGRPAPLEVELGTGKGKFLAARAESFPETNFIGIERLLDRVRKTEKKLHRNQCSNARIIRIEANYFVNFMLPEHSVSALYVFFPDPWPKRRHHRRRLFDSEFIESLVRVMIPGAPFHLRTDHEDYYQVISKLFKKDDRFEAAPPFEPTEAERTGFELLFREKGLPIYACSFRLKEG